MPIGAIVGGVGSLVSGIIGSNASKKAGQASYNAGNSLNNNINQIAQTGAGDISNSAQSAQQLMMGATSAAQNGVGTAVTGANNTLASTLNNQTANLNPYLQTGSTAAQLMNGALAPGGSLSGTFTAPTAQQAQNTPGFQFQLAQGNQAVERAAAAAGSLGSGGTLKAADQYSQGLASTYYQNAYNNALQSYQTNFQNTLNSLNAGVNTGLQGTAQYNQAAMNAGNLTASNLMNGAQYIGNAGITGAQYQGNIGLQGSEAATGTALQGATTGGNFYMQGVNGMNAGNIGAANSWMNAINGISGAAGSGLSGLLSPSTSASNMMSLPTVQAPTMNLSGYASTLPLINTNGLT